MANPNINWSSVWTGITQAAIIGSFVMIAQMYVSQTVTAEKVKAIEDKNKEQDIQFIQLWAIINKNEGIRSAERDDPKKKHD